jgi:hypothetical protein
VSDTGWMNILKNKHGRSISTGALKHNIIWDTNIGTLYRKLLTFLGLALLKAGRKLLRKSLGRCSWCGFNCGMSSSVSSKGLRCSGLGKDCEKMP